MLFASTVFASFTALLCTSLSFVDARIVPRDVIDPPITYPTAGTVWNVNEKHNVTWDTSVIPPGNNNTGMILLGFLNPNDINEHLDLKHPLAQGFPLTAGRVDIIVPSVQTRDNYILVLFGDSGNASPKFTINNISITASPSTTTAFSSASSSAFSSIPAAPAPPQGASSGGSYVASISQTLSSPDIPSAVIPSASGPSGASSAIVTSAIVTSASALAASSPSSTAPAAQTQPATTKSATPSNGGVRTRSYGGNAAWISALCSFTLALGLSL